MRRDLVQTFLKNASKAGVRCVQIGSMNEFHSAISAVIADEPLIFCPCVTPLEQSIVLPPERRTPDVAGASAAVEEVKWAIADTGTIVCVGSSREQLRTSLLPEHHIALLYGKNIYEDFLSLLNSLPVLPRNLTLITGPSRTADIEKTLVLGMHGPRRVSVFVLPDPP